jgi:hypothetical protein
MEARFIYRNRSDVAFYDASTREMRGGPDKVIVYVDEQLTEDADGAGRQLKLARDHWVPVAH